MSASLKITDLSHRYPGAERRSLSGLSLAVEPGELVAFLGPSGCGKTTALKIVAGLLRPESGEISIDGRPVSGVPPEKRGAAMVFQKSLLFPRMAVESNVGFGLRMRGMDRGEVSRRVREALRQVHMEGFAGRRPEELSGGQQQRVALARALVTGPRLLLLDEPLGALDANLRDEMRVLIKDLQREGGYTTIFVTHDQEEAVILADRIALLFDGRLQMYDRPRAYYDRPVSRRVARFFGATNFIRGRVENGAVRTPLGRLKIDEPTQAGDVTLTIRPEAVRLGTGENSFSARVTDVTYLGTRVTCGLQADGATLRIDLPPHMGLREGDTVTARLPAGALWPLGD